MSIFIGDNKVAGVGNPGRTGKPGESAYEIAKKYGYEGTEEEFALELSNVATKPDWLEEDENSPAFIKNKPSVAQVDWLEEDENSPAFIKNKPETFESAIPDWNQNDPNGEGYIENRTHWIERVPNALPVCIVENVQIVTQSIENPNGGQIGVATAPFNLGIILDKTYNIIFDNIEYQCTAYMVEGSNTIGNASIAQAGFPGNNEPFILANPTDGSDELGIITATPGTHTVSIYSLEDDEIVHTIDPKYLPDGIGGIQTQKTSDMTQLVGVDEDGLAYASKIFDGIILKDAGNGYEYVGEMYNGIFTTYCRCDHIEVTEMPTNYTGHVGDIIDSSYIKVVAIAQDGTRKDVDDFTCSGIMSDGTIFIYYTEAGITYETSIVVSAISAEDGLVDFEYVTNPDGTYTLTAWKGTYNGEPSTKIIVPNNNLYNIELEGEV